MSIENLSKSLFAQADSEARKYVEEAHLQATKIIADEHSVEENIATKMAHETATALAEFKKESMASARLQSKRILATAYEVKVQEAFDSVVESFQHLKKSPEYKKFMDHCLSKTVEEFGKNAVVHVCKGEKDFVTKNTGSSGMKNFKVLEDLETMGGSMGGLIAENLAGKARLNFSINVLLDSRKDMLRKRIQELLA